MLKKLFGTMLSFSIGVGFTPLAQAPMSAAEAAATAVTAVQTQTVGSAQEHGTSAARDLFVTVGKSLVVDSPVNIQRVSVANGELGRSAGRQSARSPGERQRPPARPA